MQAAELQIYDDRICHLGEGPLWHPLRQTLYWFDILGRRLLCPGQEWRFDEYVSAAAWVDDTRLLVASETALFTFDLETAARTHVADLEADQPGTRSNDGRADPYGGFWIGTMGKERADGAGAIYRYYRGELRQIIPDITISNAICFSPDGLWAYYTDTPGQIIYRIRLEEQAGWPVGTPEPVIDLRADNWLPDGAVIDSAGHLWNAHWGTGQVACYDGPNLIKRIPVPAMETTCPAFGGPDLKTLFITSAAREGDPAFAGKTFSIEVDVAGQTEHQVIL